MTKPTNNTFISKDKNYTRPLYKTPTKEQEQDTPLKTPEGVRFSGNVRNDGITGEFSGMNYPHCKEMLKVITHTHTHTHTPSLANILNDNNDNNNLNNRGFAGNEVRIHLFFITEHRQLLIVIIYLFIYFILFYLFFFFLFIFFFFFSLSLSLSQLCFKAFVNDWFLAEF